MFAHTNSPTPRPGRSRVCQGLVVVRRSVSEISQVKRAGTKTSRQPSRIILVGEQDESIRLHLSATRRWELQHFVDKGSESDL